jgi:5,10-methenyltetrahydrofolate synthetase
MRNGNYRTAMSHSPKDEAAGGSSPCLLHELTADGRSTIDPRQARDVAQWRKVERERLIAARLAMDAHARRAQTEAIAKQLDALIAEHQADIVSVYWPIRGEPDLRAWMQQRYQRGTRIALPVALEPHRALSFREWQPTAPLARGLWKIPYPAEGAEVTPAVVLAPLVGFDAEGYRLGYGGAFFDRTLALLHPRPLTIGVGYASAQIRTIFPQPYDIPMDWIVTGTSPPFRSRPRSA